jgi:hypothetical protein
MVREETVRAMSRVVSVFLTAWLVLASANSAFGQAGGYGGGAPGGSGGFDEGQQSDDDGPKGTRLNISPREDPYTAAMIMRQRGNYAEAMPILQELADLGRGFEMAQLELGNCYFDLARRAKDDHEAQRKRTIGLAWVLKAAYGGLGAADERLVRLYLDGEGIPADRLEAGRWYLLWQHNPSRLRLGAAGFNDALEQRLKGSLTPSDWVEAEHRASAGLR